MLSENLKFSLTMYVYYETSVIEGKKINYCLQCSHRADVLKGGPPAYFINRLLFSKNKTVPFKSL